MDIIKVFPSIIELYNEVAPALLLVISVIIFTIFIKVLGTWVKKVQ